LSNEAIFFLIITSYIDFKTAYLNFFVILTSLYLQNRQLNGILLYKLLKSHSYEEKIACF